MYTRTAQPRARPAAGLAAQRRTVAALTATIVVTAAGWTAAPAAAQEARTDARLDSIFAAYAAGNSPGCALSVVRAGEPVISRGWGMATLEHDVPITPATSFYAASVSKQFAAFAVALLIDDGRLSLDDDVRRWIPEVPDFGPTITVRHLVHHTSGLRDYFGLLGLTGWPGDGPLTLPAFLDLVGRQRALNFEPGSEFLYSNTGYVLLSVLVERVSGQSLRDFSAARMFAPLGMSATVFRDDHALPVRGRAQGYVSAPDGGWRISMPGFDVIGDGGLYTTVEDLARWDRNFITREVGGEAVAALVHTRGRLNNGAELPYAFGIGIGTWRGQANVQHGGSFGGYRAMFSRFPDAGLSVALLCNAGTANSTVLAQRVAELFIGDRLTPPLAPPTAAAGPGGAAPTGLSAPVQPAVLEAFIGTYYSSELDTTWRIAEEEGALVARRAALPAQRLTATGAPGSFSVGSMTLRFGSDAAGDVTHFTVDAGRIRGVRFDVR